MPRSRAANPFTTVRHRDVAADARHARRRHRGRRRIASRAEPAGFTFVGVAPEADIIVVANRSSGVEGLGTSANTLDAVNYIYQRAGTLEQGRGAST